MTLRSPITISVRFRWPIRTRRGCMRDMVKHKRAMEDQLFSSPHVIISKRNWRT